MRTVLDIHGLRLELSSESGPLGRAVEHVVRHLGLPEAVRGAPDLVVGVGVAPRPPAPASPPTASHGSGYLRVWQRPDEVVLRTAALHLAVQPERGIATCSVAPNRVDGPGLVPELVVGVLSAAFLMLRPRGLFPLHAAALAHGEHGLLLVAESDAGKSTTAYRLVRHGWRFLSDDSVLLRPAADRVEAVAFRRTFGLDAGAEALFPELGRVEDRQPADPDKRSVPVAALYPEQAALYCRPRVLVFPEIVDREESALVPLSRTEAMLGLAGQSALVTLRPDWAPGHLAVLGRLVGQTDAYRLHAGRDLLRDPLRIVHLLDTVWPEPLLDAVPIPHA